MKHFIVCALLLQSLLSCGPQNGTDTTTTDSTGKDSTASTPQKSSVAPAEVPLLLPTLLLSKADFDALRPPPSKLMVFQFRYAATATCATPPTLMAYAMKNNRDFSSVSKLMTPFSNSTEPVYGRETIYGDNEILIRELEGLVDEMTGSHGGNGAFTALLFTPKYNTATKHIYYDITVAGATGSPAVPGLRTTNPSPPAKAE